MEVKEYIESGVIEAYALGMLAEGEARAVEQMAEEHPAVKAALTDAQKTMDTLSKSYAVTPKPEWKDEILSAAFGERSKENIASSQTTHSLGKPPENNKKTSSFNWAAAATIALLISLGFNFFQFFSLNNMSEEIAQNQLRIAELEQSNQVMVANYRQADRELAILSDPNTESLMMKGVDGRDENYRADVYWNATSKMVYLKVKNLPAPPNGKQYQLWALRNGTPIDMGVFNGPDPEGSLKEMGNVPGAQGFAVTLEPMGGSKDPTMEEMYVHGEFTSA